MSLKKLSAMGLPLAVVAALVFGAGAGASPEGVAAVTDDDARVVQGGQSGCVYFDFVVLYCGFGYCGDVPSECGTSLAAVESINGRNFGYGVTISTPCQNCGGWICGWTNVTTAYPCAVVVGDQPVTPLSP